jgi:outer membrane protein assembly factor BamB
MHRVDPSDHPVEVEIVEVRDLAGARHGDDAAPSRPRRLAVWVGAAVLVGLTVVVVGSNLMEARRQDSRFDALSDVAGVLTAIDGPVQEVWRVPGGQVLANSPGAIVLIDQSDASLRGIDPGTGVVLWQRAVGADETCLPVGGVGADGTTRSPVLVVCAPVQDADTGTALSARVVALDLATGRELRVLDLPGPAMTVDVVDDDLVVSRIGDRGTVHVLRWDPGAGRVVWSYRSEPGVADSLLRDGWWDSVLDRGVLWFGRDRMIALAAASGQEVPADDPPAFWSVGGVATLPDGGVAEWTHDLSGDPTATRVFDPDGRLRFTFDGEPWLAEVSDGSEPGVLAMRRTAGLDVVGLDARTGEQKWAATTLQGMYPYLQIDGIVVSTGSLRAIALDVATGTRVWEQPIARPRTWPLTDGRVVLLLTRDEGLIGLSAFDLRTGAERWRVPLPTDATYLDVGGSGTVLVHTVREVVAYR